MHLNISFNGVSKPKPQADNIVQVCGERLMDMFETVGAAFAAHEQWQRWNKPQIHHWTTYNQIAKISATCGLSPSERQAIAFKVGFGNDQN